MQKIVQENCSAVLRLSWQHQNEDVQENKPSCNAAKMLSWHVVFSVIKACAAAPTCVPHSLQHGHQVYVVHTCFMGQKENILLG